MEETKIPDYKLDEGYLKEMVLKMMEKPSAENFTIKLPGSVQVIQIIKSTPWNSYILADGEFQMSECVFMSKQAKPKCFSILKIKKICQLPLHMRMDNNTLYRARIGEIEFETQVSGEEIGHSLYKDLKEMNMQELLIRKEHLKTFKAPKPVEIMKHMWENRSEKFSDVKFTFEGNEGAVVYANKTVLVAVSEVFKVHFDSEGFVDNKSVHIVDSSLYSFNKLLEFIYTGKVQFTTWRVAFELLYLSKKYLLSHLEDLCQRVIIEFCNYDREHLLKVSKDEKKEVELYFDLRTVITKSRISEGIQNRSNLERSCKLTRDEWREFRLHFKDYRGHLSDKIEDFGVTSESENKSKILSLLIDINFCTDQESFSDQE